ncbi:MAG: Tat pathway signal protein, partial [Rhizobiales bacterium 39-66-18]
MKLVLPAVAATTTLLSPVLAEARQVTFETTLKNYGGNGAYVVLYVTDASGAYKGTLWMAGGKAKYYRHLSDWQRA